MPSNKRQRQRVAREAARAAARAAQRRRQRNRQILALVAVAAVIMVGGFFITRDTSAGAKKNPETTTTVADASSPKARVAAFNKLPEGEDQCPPADGSGERKTAGFPASGAPRCIDTDNDYSAEVETDVGSFTIDFTPNTAPLTVNNFVFLARNKAYDGAPFHRVITGFVVQGGDFEKGDGTGGPGYQFADELPEAGSYEIGSVAMANSGPDGGGTNGSQFFVITGDQGVALPPSYSLFGKVTAGLDIVKKIEADGTTEGAPSVTHTILKVTIRETKK